MNFLKLFNLSLSKHNIDTSSIYNIYLPKDMQSLDKHKIISLIFGILGIYLIYSIIGIIQEAVIKQTYRHNITGQNQSFDFPESQLLVCTFFSYSVAFIFNRIMYRSDQVSCIPNYNGFKCGSAVALSTITYSYAIKLTNFPVVMMVRSCNVLSVVLVGVLFSGVKDTTVKLGKKKIIIALVATCGMIIFKVFDLNTSGSTINTETVGIILILVSLMADGFLPDFQAVIKTVYKPPAIVMLEMVNKWATIICLIFTISTGHLVPVINFILTHDKLVTDLILIGILSAVGQFFVYYLCNVFKQHIVPLIVGTRKIFTVALSIAYYGHDISIPQILGLFIVLGISLFEFFAESQVKKQQVTPKPPLKDS